jgi:DNA-binding winged helix-turn-helix (wHTH) protein
MFAFGDFRFDPGKRRLQRGDEQIDLSDLQSDVLAHLVQAPGVVVSKDDLIAAAWYGVAVTNNSVEQIVSDLRRALRENGKQSSLIETVPRRGYRFAAEVIREALRASDVELETLLAPYKAWIEGQSELDTLGRDAMLRAEAAFTGVITRVPEYAPAHRGLANAYVMQFESTRADAAPNAHALRAAAHHAREACRLDAHSAEGWATLAQVELRLGRTLQAVAAARRAVALEPDNWRHQCRLAYVAWGEERLRAAQRTLVLFPQFGLAHWFAATVYVARQALDRAEEELRAGAAAQDKQDGSDLFPSLGSHWILGLVRLARGDRREAFDEFHRELAFESMEQVFSRECIANTWYAIGALALREGRRADATRAFEQSIQRVPAHLLATTGLLIAGGRTSQSDLRIKVEDRVRQLTDAGLLVDAAMGRAILLRAESTADESAATLGQALGAAVEGSDGWLVPIEPLLNVTAAGPAFNSVLAKLRARAA